MITIIDTLDAVSYTHLDVYKRQEENILWLNERGYMGDVLYEIFEFDVKNPDKEKVKKLRNTNISAIVCEPFMGPPLKRAISVSYTHLDVYKRQPCLPLGVDVHRLEPLPQQLASLCGVLRQIQGTSPAIEDRADHPVVADGLADHLTPASPNINTSRRLDGDLQPLFARTRDDQHLAGDHLVGLADVYKRQWLCP